MDPAKRNLLEVKVEEMEAADGIFTKLMGDLVDRAASSSRTLGADRTGVVAGVAVSPMYIPRRLRTPSSALRPSVHGIRRATLINSDVVRSAELVELRRTRAELKATLTEPLSRQHQDIDARAIGKLGRDRDRDRGARPQGPADPALQGPP